MKLNIKDSMYLRYNLIVPSVSPSEFFATHLYEPKSPISTGVMVSVITVLYAWSNESGLNRLSEKDMRK